MQPTSQYMQAGQVEMQMPWYVQVLEDIPGIPTVAMVNANRTANTLMLGARKSKHVGQVAGMASQTWNPMNALRFGTDDFLFNPSKTMGKGGSYTPYAGARMMNSALDRWGKKGGFRFEEGFLGRVSAASKLSNMSEKQFGRYARKATQGGAMKRTVGFSPNQTSPKLLNMMGGAANISKASSRYGLSAGAVASRGALMTGGRASGFMAGALDYVDDASRFSRTGAGATSVARRELGEGVTEKALKGFNKAKSMAKGGSMAKTGLRAAGYAGKAARLTNPIGWAMMAYDITKLGVRGVGYAARLGFEARESRNRGLNTQIGGQLHVDTEAALTSRSRGVQAIQNSRLNARSVLGVEAGSMHSYYG